MESIWNAPFVETEKLAACAAASARLLPPRGQCRGRRALPALYRSVEEIRRDTALLRRRSQAAAQLPPPGNGCWTTNILPAGSSAAPPGTSPGQGVCAAAGRGSSS